MFRASPKTRKILIVLIKLSISVSLCYFVLNRIDLSGTISTLFQVSGLLWLAIAMSILLAQALLAAVRLRLIVKTVEGTCRLVDGFIIWMVGLFVSQTMVTIVAGDLMRAYQLRQLGNTPFLSGNAIVIDRLVGVTTLLLLGFLFLPFLALETTHRGIGDLLLHLFLNILVLILLAVLSFFLFRKRIGRVLSRIPPLQAINDYLSTHLKGLPRFGFILPAFLLSACMHFCNILCMYVFVRYLEVDIAFWPLACVVLPVMFLMLLPISFAGWGVREGSMSLGFGLLGVTANEAVAVSLAFGVALLLTSLPGVLGLITRRRVPALGTTHYREFLKSEEK